MRTEQEVRDLYKQYVYRYAIAIIDKDKTKENIFFGASLALGRTLKKDLKKINKDYDIAIVFINRLREEGKELPGFKDI